jgi:hypothetical protein
LLFFNLRRKSQIKTLSIKNISYLISNLITLKVSFYKYLEGFQDFKVSQQQNVSRPWVNFTNLFRQAKRRFHTYLAKKCRSFSPTNLKANIIGQNSPNLGAICRTPFTKKRHQILCAKMLLKSTQGEKLPMGRPEKRRLKGRGAKQRIIDVF